MSIAFLTSERGRPDMGGNNRGAHLSFKGNHASAWAPTDAEAKQRLVKVAREFAAELVKWADKQEAAKARRKSRGAKSASITVVRWDSWVSPSDADDESDPPVVCPAVSCGGSGGWVAGHTWAEYIEDHDAEARPYLEALRAEIVRLGIKRGGDWHQREGVPVFSDGTVGHFSMRAWGDLCAAIWNTHNRVGHIGPRDYGYMDFYMDEYGRGTDQSTGVPS